MGNKARKLTCCIRNRNCSLSSSKLIVYTFLFSCLNIYCIRKCRRQKAPVMVQIIQILRKKSLFSLSRFYRYLQIRSRLITFMIFSAYLILLTFNHDRKPHHISEESRKSVHTILFHPTNFCFGSHKPMSNTAHLQSMHKMFKLFCLPSYV